MALTRKEFEELADIVATIHSTHEESGKYTPDYLQCRIIMFCDEFGHNFNESLFLKRITDIRNKLNEVNSQFI